MGTLLVGIFIGLGTSSLVKWPEAQASNSAAGSVPVNGKKEWEFKVAGFPQDVAKSEELLNKLASERWEYVGLIKAEQGWSLVAFKRLK